MRSAQLCVALTLLFTASAVMGTCLFPAMAAVSPLARDVSTVAGAAFALAVAVAAQRRPALLRERVISLAMFALLVASLVLLGVGVGRQSPLLVLAGSPFGGMAPIWFSVLAGVALTRVERWRCAIVIPLALVAGVLVRMVLVGVGGGIGLPAAMVLYVSCIGAAYLLVIPLVEQLLAVIVAGEPPLVLDATNPSSYLPATSVVYVTAFLFQLANGYAFGQHEQALPPSETLMALAPVGVVLAWAVSRRGRGLSCDNLERGAALVVIGGLMLAPAALSAAPQGGTWAYASAVLLHGGSDCFTVLMYFIVASVGARNPLGALVTAATMMAADWLGMMSGALLMGACRSLAVGDPMLMLVATAIVAFLFTAYHLTVLARFSFDASIDDVVPLDPAGEGRPGGARVPEEGVPEGADAGETRLEEACAAVAADHGLTARELDVLRLLARGRTSPVIQERLVVSHNTVKSHVRHIYAKVGVHSQQQLIDVVEARKGGPR